MAVRPVTSNVSTDLQDAVGQTCSKRVEVWVTSSNEGEEASCCKMSFLPDEHGANCASAVGSATNSGASRDVFLIGVAVSSLVEMALRYYERGQRWETPSNAELRKVLSIGVAGGVVGMLLGGGDSIPGIVEGAIVLPVALRILRLLSHSGGVQGAVERLQKAELAAHEQPDKAQPLSDVSGARLELYFERNLIQLRSVYWLTISVLIGGFFLIGYGVFQAFQQGTRIEAAGLTAAAGVLTEFVAATFLVVFRSTLAQASSFVKALERINAFGMASKLVESIPDSADMMRQRAKARLALGIVASIAVVKPEPKASQKEKGKRD